MPTTDRMVRENEGTSGGRGRGRVQRRAPSGPQRWTHRRGSPISSAKWTPTLRTESTDKDAEDEDEDTNEGADNNNNGQECTDDAEEDAEEEDAEDNTGGWGVRKQPLPLPRAGSPGVRRRVERPQPGCDTGTRPVPAGEAAAATFGFFPTSGSRLFSEDAPENRRLPQLRMSSSPSPSSSSSSSSSLPSSL